MWTISGQRNPMWSYYCTHLQAPIAFTPEASSLETYRHTCSQNMAPVDINTIGSLGLSDICLAPVLQRPRGRPMEQRMRETKWSRAVAQGSLQEVPDNTPPSVNSSVMVLVTIGGLVRKLYVSQAAGCICSSLSLISIDLLVAGQVAFDSRYPLIRYWVSCQMTSKTLWLWKGDILLNKTIR